MKLRSDALGNFDNPTAQNIEDAILYPNSENYIVRLDANDYDYLARWVGSKDVGHRLVLRFDNTTIECSKKLDSNTAIIIMKKYLIQDMEWFKEYSWNQPISEKFIQNLCKIL